MWQVRHVAAFLIGAAMVGGFFLARENWSPMHAWNRAFGDASMVLVALAMVAGPLARLWPRFQWLVPWRRETGIHGIILAIVHGVIILDGWVEWDLPRLLGYVVHPQTQDYIMLQHGFGLGNMIGFGALGYGLVLMITSNDASQKLLGTTWKFVQLGAYPLWALSVTHVAYFLYLHFQDFHRQVPEPNWLQWPFVALVFLVLSLQVVAMCKVWIGRRRPALGPIANPATEAE